VRAQLGGAFDNCIGNIPISGNGFTTISGWSGTCWSALFTGNVIIKTV